MTISDLLSAMVGRLEKAGVDSPRLDAEIIITRALSVPRYSFIADPFLEVSPEKAAVCEALASRRIEREPVAYIFNEKEFYGLDFFVDRRVLIPRPETELLAETAIRLLPSGGRLLDLCTGSGAVAVTAAAERPDCEVTASDISSDAVDVARINSEKLAGGRVRVVQSDLFAAFPGMTFDGITANPPYIDPALSGKLQPELAYEPGIALYSDTEGRHLIERIVAEFRPFLEKTGFLAMEIGYDQGLRTQALALESGLKCRIEKDLAGHDRVAVIRI